MLLGTLEELSNSPKGFSSPHLMNNNFDSTHYPKSSQALAVSSSEMNHSNSSDNSKLSCLTNYPPSSIEIDISDSSSSSSSLKKPSDSSPFSQPSSTSWSVFLKKWSLQIIHKLSETDFLDEIPRQYIEAGYLGEAPATMDEIRFAEARLGIKALPTSYVDFLTTSNGFFRTTTTAGRLLPASEISWLRQKYPELIQKHGLRFNAIREANLDHAENHRSMHATSGHRFSGLDFDSFESRPKQEQFLIYGDLQKPEMYRFSDFENSLLISSIGEDNSVYLLIPTVTFSPENPDKMDPSSHIASFSKQNHRATWHPETQTGSISDYVVDPQISSPSSYRRNQFHNRTFTENSSTLSTKLKNTESFPGYSYHPPPPPPPPAKLSPSSVLPSVSPPQATACSSPLVPNSARLSCGGDYQSSPASSSLSVCHDDTIVMEDSSSAPPTLSNSTPKKMSRSPIVEWEAWFFADWIPGAMRYKSFKDLMAAEYNSFLDVEYSEYVMNSPSWKSNTSLSTNHSSSASSASSPFKAAGDSLLPTLDSVPNMYGKTPMFTNWRVPFNH